MKATRQSQYRSPGSVLSRPVKTAPRHRRLIAGAAGLAALFLLASPPAFGEAINDGRYPHLQQPNAYSGNFKYGRRTRQARRTSPQEFALFGDPAVQDRTLRGYTRQTASTDSACLPSSLRQALADVRGRFGSIQVVSTHRPGAVIAGSRKPSYHRNCQAVDFRPPSGKYGAVAAYLKSTWSGGIGTYASGHIHIDTGPSYRWYTGGGQKVARRGHRPTGS